MPEAERRMVTFDEQTALTYTGGDRRLLKQVIGLFRADAPVGAPHDDAGDSPCATARRCESPRTRSRDRSAPSARRPAARRAGDLEQLGREGRLEHAAPKVDGLRTELANLDAAFAQSRPRRRAEGAKADAKPKCTIAKPVRNGDNDDQGADPRRRRRPDDASSAAGHSPQRRLHGRRREGRRRRSR